MKKFFRSVYLFFKGIGYARAASMHARSSRALRSGDSCAMHMWLRGHMTFEALHTVDCAQQLQNILKPDLHGLSGTKTTRNYGLCPHRQD